MCDDLIVQLRRIDDELALAVMDAGRDGQLVAIARQYLEKRLGDAIDNLDGPEIEE